MNDSSLLSKWDYEKNNIMPDKISYGSKRRVWFKGECGHSWEASPCELRRGRGCPYCHGLKVLKGFNDFESKYPNLARQWHPTKNENLTPDKITYGSKKKVWWLGDCGHEWVAQINNRRYNPGCPICGSRIIEEGYNDLLHTRPDLARQWHPSKNGCLKPKDVSQYSNQSVWWLGECGHEWKTTVENRSYGSGCPICKVERSTSFSERAIAYYLSKYVLVEESTHPLKTKREIDVLLPSLKIAIEYDGEAFHTDVKQDELKNIECHKCGLKIIRVREPNCPQIWNCQKVLMQGRNDECLTNAIKELMSMIFGNDSKSYDVDVSRDRIEIYESYIFSEIMNSRLNVLL